MVVHPRPALVRQPTSSPSHELVGQLGPLALELRRRLAHVTIPVQVHALARLQELLDLQQVKEGPPYISLLAQLVYMAPKVPFLYGTPGMSAQSRLEAP